MENVIGKLLALKDSHQFLNGHFYDDFYGLLEILNTENKTCFDKLFANYFGCNYDSFFNLLSSSLKNVRGEQVISLSNLLYQNRNVTSAATLVMKQRCVEQLFLDSSIPLNQETSYTLFSFIVEQEATQHHLFIKIKPTENKNVFGSSKSEVVFFPTPAVFSTVYYQMKELLSVRGRDQKIDAIMETAFHEVGHCMKHQFQLDPFSYDWNLCAIYMTHIVSSYNPENVNVHHQNYQVDPGEISARLYSLERRLEVAVQYPKLYSVSKLKSFRKELLRENALYQFQRLYRYPKRGYVNKFDLLNEKLDVCVEESPGILKDYVFLNKLYHSNTKKKTIPELIMDYKEECTCWNTNLEFQKKMPFASVQQFYRESIYFLFRSLNPQQQVELFQEESIKNTLFEFFEQIELDRKNRVLEFEKFCATNRSLWNPFTILRDKQQLKGEYSEAIKWKEYVASICQNLEISMIPVK